MSIAEQIRLSLDILDDVARVLAATDLSKAERAEYEAAGQEARERLAEAQATA